MRSCRRLVKRNGVGNAAIRDTDVHKASFGNSNTDITKFYNIVCKSGSFKRECCEPEFSTFFSLRYLSLRHVRTCNTYTHSKNGPGDTQRQVPFGYRHCHFPRYASYESVIASRCYAADLDGACLNGLLSENIGCVVFWTPKMVGFLVVVPLPAKRSKKEWWVSWWFSVHQPKRAPPNKNRPSVAK